MTYPPKWTAEWNYLARVFVFDNFVQAVEFINIITPLAERMGHHPDLELYSYNKLKIKISTHDAGNIITQKDIDLAQQINELIE